MTGIAELHAQALDITGRIVAGIPPDRWHTATPCTGWDTQALLNHVVSGNLWAAELAAGATIETIGDRLDGDVLGADPAGSYAVSAKAAAAAFLRPGALDAPCAVSYGPVPGSVYAGHRFIEMVFTQLAKRAVRPVGGGREHVADLDVAVGDDDAVDEQLGQLPPLLEGGGGQAGADGLAECLDSVGDSAEFQPLPGGGIELALLGEQRVTAAVQVLALAV